MTMRILADDGSIHQFPDGTPSGVITATLARYHASLGANGSPPQPAPYWPPLRDKASVLRQTNTTIAC